MFKVNEKSKKYPYFMSFVTAVSNLNFTDLSLKTLAPFAEDESLRDVKIQELLFNVITNQSNDKIL